MKKLKILLLALSLIVPALVARASASAEVVLNQRDAFTLILGDSCTGEVVTVTGEIHRVIRSRVGNDGTTHLDIHVDSHGQGIGNSSGKQYVWNDSSDASTNNPVGCEFFHSFVRYARLISKGHETNRMLRITFSFSYDADCVLTGGSTMDLICTG
jgi:hypothetical protein